MKKISPGALLKYFVLVIAAVSVLLPFWLLFIASLRNRMVLFEYPPTLWPYDATIENYKELLISNNEFLHWFKNSFIVSSAGTILSVFVCVLAGYAFAKKQFPAKTILYLMIIATMIVPGAVTLFPTFKVVKFFNLINTLPGMFITSIASVFGMMLLKQFIEGIPNSIIESAVIDGAGDYCIFFRIILPMSISAVALLIIWCFMGHWNNLLWPLIITNTQLLKTIPVGIAGMRGKTNSPWNVMMAATTLSMIPIVVVFFCFRRKFIEGMTAGAIKG
jgi:ABC-type glycerol-3-phosphate transport system permease component